MDVQSIISPALTDAVSAAGTILLGLLAAYVKQHWTAKQVDNAKSAALIAVNAAEEIGRVTGIKGQDKLNTALNQVKLEAKKMGIKFTDEQWQGYLRDAVSNSRSVWNAIQGSPDPEPAVISTVESSTETSAPVQAVEQPVVVFEGRTPVQPTVQETVTQAIRQTVQPVAQQAADQAVQDIISQAVQSAVKQIGA